MKKIDKFLLLAILIFISFKPVSNKWIDYKLGIKSAENAIYNFHLTMEKDAYQSFDPEDPEEISLKLNILAMILKNMDFMLYYAKFQGHAHQEGQIQKVFLI